MEETRTRSMAKGLFYRSISILTLILITYFYTGDILHVSLITCVSTVIFIVVFFIHERIWLHIETPKGKLTRSITKMFTYITLLGITVMSIITYVFTRSVEIMTNITVSYVIVKHFLYVINEFFWDTTKWGKT